MKKEIKHHAFEQLYNNRGLMLGHFNRPQSYGPEMTQLCNRLERALRDLDRVLDSLDKEKGQFCVEEINRKAAQTEINDIMNQLSGICLDMETMVKSTRHVEDGTGSRQSRLSAAKAEEQKIPPDKGSQGDSEREEWQEQQDERFIEVMQCHILLGTVLVAFEVEDRFNLMESLLSRLFGLQTDDR